jgi:hypothetical protein
MKEKQLNEQLSKMRNMMDISEEMIEIPDDSDLMNFFHGGDLDDIKYDIQQKSDRQQYGSGLYLTTYYDVAKKYARGNRKMYLVSVQKGVDIRDKKVGTETLMRFLNQTFPKKTAQNILNLANYRIHNGVIPLYLVNNILINHNHLKGSRSVLWRTFLVGLGVDYEIIDNAFGYHETMMVLYNLKLIKSVKRIQPKHKLPTYDLKNR